MPTVDDISYDIRISRKARRISIRIKEHQKIELVVPVRGSQKRAEEFLRSKIPWIAKTIEKQRMKPKKKSMQWIDGESIVFFDDQLMLRVTVDNRKQSVFRYGDELHVCVRVEHPALIEALVTRWYKDQAYIFIKGEADRIVYRLHTEYRNISIKDQKSLWGSCSKQKNLNFNWRLMMAPKEIVRSIVVHECAHLLHMNHSKAFWTTVGQVDQDYKKHHIWLRQHGYTLR